MRIAKTGLIRRRRRLADTRDNPESAESAVKRPHEPAARQHGPAGGKPDGPAASVRLELPLVTVRMRVPRMPLPRVPLGEAGVVIDAARSLLPPPERVIYYGSRGALAAVDLIEWPVAAVIGLSTVVAQRAVGYLPQAPGNANGTDGAGGAGDGARGTEGTPGTSAAGGTGPNATTG